AYLLEVAAAGGPVRRLFRTHKDREQDRRKDRDDRDDNQQLDQGKALPCTCQTLVPPHQIGGKENLPCPPADRGDAYCLHVSPIPAHTKWVHIGVRLTP